MIIESYYKNFVVIFEETVPDLLDTIDIKSSTHNLIGNIEQVIPAYKGLYPWRATMQRKPAK